MVQNYFLLATLQMSSPCLDTTRCTHGGLDVTVVQSSLCTARTTMDNLCTDHPTHHRIMLQEDIKITAIHVCSI